MPMGNSQIDEAQSDGVLKQSSGSLHRGMVMQSRNLLRLVPSDELIAWRKRYLEDARLLKLQRPHLNEPPGLAPGNRKTGVSGSRYKSVLVWNIPAAASCPGASQWCLSHCYNADDRKNIFPVADWMENWAWAVYRPTDLRAKIMSQVLAAQPPCCVRIHSSGDFFSVKYTDWWHEIVAATPGISYWAYTRSWIVPSILVALERLRGLRNLQLFASVDDTMPAPPEGWRYSTVFDAPDEATRLLNHSDSLLCPEQFGLVPNCASCGFCIEPKRENVSFILH